MFFRITRLILIFILSLLFIKGSGAAPEQRRGSGEERKFIIFVMDEVNWEDYLAAADPSLQKLLEGGAVGLMTARTAGSPERGGFLTIGAGTRLRAGEDQIDMPNLEGFAFQPQETTAFGPAAEIYGGLTGKSAKGAALLHLGLPAILHENEDLNYTATPGLLGELLKQNGKKVACLGNADYLGQSNRPAVAIAMDAGGRVALGDISDKLIVKSPAALPALSGKALLKAFDEVLPQADFLVVDYGDTSRIEHCSALMTDEAIEQQRLQALRGAGAFLEAALARLKGRAWRMLIITPHYRREKVLPCSRLSPIIYCGSDIGPGLLTSDSTRERGIMTNTDIAPTVLGYFGIAAPPQMVGRPMQIKVSAGQSPTAWLTETSTRLALVDSQRFILTRPAMTVIIIIFAACGFAFLLGERTPRWLRRLLGPLCLAVISWPLVAALIGLYISSLPAISLLLTIAGCIILTFAAVKLSSAKIPPFVWLSAFTFLYLAVGVLLPDQSLLRYSPLSYSPADGARYYGLGNELGGALLGAFIIAAGGLWQGSSRLARRLRWPLMAGVVLLLGMSKMGANFGMALAAAIGFFAVGALLLKCNRWRSGAWAVMLLAVLVALVAADSLQKSGTSHIGHAAQQLQQPAQADLGGLIARKLEMNWKLFRNSMWAEVLVAAFVPIILLAFKPNPRLKEMLKASPGIRIAIYGAIIGALAAFVFNDSGTLAAALCMLYPGAVAPYLAFSGDAE